MKYIFLCFLLVAFEIKSEDRLCGTETNIEPGHHYVEGDFNKDAYEKAIKLVVVEEELKNLELFTFVNAQTIIEGYYLKKQAEAHPQMVDFFCHFLKNNAVIAD